MFLFLNYYESNLKRNQFYEYTNNYNKDLGKAKDISPTHKRDQYLEKKVFLNVL